MFGIALLSSFSAQPCLSIRPEIAVVVRQHDDVAPGRLPPAQLGAELGVVEARVVVDVFDVVDVDAVLLLELDQGRERVVLLVRVDVVAASWRSGASSRAAAWSRRKTACAPPPPPPQAASSPGTVRIEPLAAARRRKVFRVMRSVMARPPERRRRRCFPGSS